MGILIPLEQLKFVKTVQIKTGESESPPSNKSWFIIGGAVKHITGSNSTFVISDGNNVYSKTFIDTSVGSANYSLLNMSASLNQEMLPQVIHSGDEITFTGGTGALINLRVVEF